jgi:exonuclease SbcC
MRQFLCYVDEEITRDEFSELNEQRLFLLEGVTGSGKSAIIDGIVFALYGTDTKDRADEVRRNSAPDDQDTTVTLEFEVDGCRYRVERSPQRKDPDTGKIKKKHKVSLTEIDGKGKPVPHRSWDQVTQTGTQITSTIGLTREQFTRIVVLPQGKFARFLSSTTIDRKTLLEAIFPVDHWKEIQSRIADERGTAKKTKTKLLDAAKQAAAVARKDTNADSGTPVKAGAAVALKTIDEVRGIQSEATSKITEWTNTIESEEKKLAERRKALDDEKKGLDEQAKMNEAIEERKKLLKNKEALDELEKSITPMQKALTKHHDAEKLKPVLFNFESQKAALLENTKDIDEYIADSGMDANLKEKSPEEINQKSQSIATKVTKAEALVKDKNQLKNITESLKGLGEAEGDAISHYGQLQYEQHKSWATQMADSLDSGKPCLVCGSTEHPTPAVDEGLEDTELGGALTAVEHAKVALKQAKDRESELSDSVQNKRDELKLNKEEDVPDVKSLKAEGDALQGLYDLKHSNGTLSTALSGSQSAWEVAVNPHKLETMEKIEALILGSEKKSELSEAIATYDNRRAVNKGGLEKQEVIDAEGKQVVDITKDLENLGDLLDDLVVDEKAHDRMETRLSDLKSSESTLSISIIAHTDFSAGMADLQWVDDHLRGVNKGGKMQMDVIAWILRRWFEEALVKANKRLEEIGSGQYSLEMVQAGGGDKKAGLNIGVVDAFSSTLKPRSTKSLSGGEEFYVSLALALGMSDVVSQYAGGVRLGTLFIDEGFGHLSPDVLDDVMIVIDEVGGEDRIIGLISHIESVKKRIPSRISCTKNGDGTSTIDVQA